MGVASENSVQIDSRSAAESEHHLRMIALGLLFLCLLCDRFKPRRQLEAEILVLRHQLNILQQRAPGRPHLRWVDRALFRVSPLTGDGSLVHPEAGRGLPKRCAT
jgi:hypothetical protein